MADRRNPTQAQLRQLLDYDPETGVLTWKERPLRFFSAETKPLRRRAWLIWNAKYPGATAGAKAAGYIQIKVFDRNFPAHRVIWALIHGYWPYCIDHINGDPSDNRLANLRNVSRQVNQRNQKTHKSNTSGRTGVSWNRFTEKWVAQIKMDDTTIYLGSYDDFDQAVAARASAERENGFTGRA